MFIKLMYTKKRIQDKRQETSTQKYIYSGGTGAGAGDSLPGTSKQRLQKIKTRHENKKIIKHKKCCWPFVQKHKNTGPSTTPPLQQNKTLQPKAGKQQRAHKHILLQHSKPTTAN